MLMTTLVHLRAWLAQYHPRKRLARKKRELQAVCRANGCSRTQAEGIASGWFK